MTQYKYLSREKEKNSCEWHEEVVFVYCDWMGTHVSAGINTFQSDVGGEGWRGEEGESLW